MRRAIGPLCAGLVLAGCATTASQRIDDREDLLWKAGFMPHNFQTPLFATAVQKLPPHMFAHHTVNGVTTYYYLDPTICHCVYTGTEQNWQAYKSDVSTRLHMDAEIVLLKEDTPIDTGGG
jgi:hypothetical protein